MATEIRIKKAGWAIWLRSRLLADNLPATLCAAALMGLLGALATVVFREMLAWTQMLLGGEDTPHGMVSLARGLSSWQRFLMPAIGGAIAGAILQMAARWLPRRGAADYMEAISIGRGVIGFRQTVARSLSSIFSIGSGASIGREGPMVQLAAMLSSLTGRYLVLPPRHLRLLVACGATAGITSAYNAPIAGALFISEIVYGAIASATLVPLVVSSVVANIVTRQILHYDAVFHMPPFTFVSGWEVINYLGLGVIAGLAAPQFLRFLDTARAAFGRVPAPLWARMALGGLIVGALSVVNPEVWGNGYSVVNSMLHTQWAWQAVAAILLLKTLATAASVGSGAVGGVFTPTLFVGAALGALYGTGLQALFPAGDLSAVSSYAVVGMGALLAATTYAPLMSILMIFEMTLSYEVMLPLMLACITGYVIAHRIRPDSVYAKSLASNRRAQRVVAQDRDE
ncbi:MULTISPECIES: ClcB-like voltage-gated chloride channel protein [Achromobacter]|uniref:Voltage-gated chloride channel ClcB n=1 Tax=Alcaligenes xylosoxydans xylosoxydans TaxID=85698 RepID=A0A424WDE6_ALCXX|nr:MULTISPECIES: ClcB-like voltage-gated chloride channel protein [Achromobacter]MBC9906072.1 ClcB-like voltage-gated chloride channel protein [Achromobacter xylosoxidans]MBD0869798.1 ClcB-like voltage-gated chloride channel protein [Achromobacter xylosoxidans]MDH1298736.1 ClcB-like voltage-gated chloride channel protein [Achromobacter sp. GD03932]QNP85925.1 ClcB-like voltage-gated chloride channel protein [Achromobacter xylosoxidans]RPJ91270.1 voltage-gated chloride channel ClcB [Achromobacte